jgi:hypothetical protein
MVEHVLQHSLSMGKYTKTVLMEYLQTTKTQEMNGAMLMLMQEDLQIGAIANPY